MVEIINAETLPLYKEFISKWEKEFFPYPWNEKDWDGLELAQRFSLCVSKDPQGELTGYQLFDVLEAPSSGHLLKIFVAPESRNFGYAKEMLQKVIFEFKLEQVYLEVGVNNSPALSFYRSFGFEILSRKEKFYSDGEAAFAMLLKCD